MFWRLICSKLWKSEGILFVVYLFLACSCFSALWASVNGLNKGHRESNCFTNSAIAVVWDMSPRACQACLEKTTQRITIKHDILSKLSSVREVLFSIIQYVTLLNISRVMVCYHTCTFVCHIVEFMYCLKKLKMETLFTNLWK